MPGTPSGGDGRAGAFLLVQSTPEPVYAFHPKPLPPDPKLRIDAVLQARLDGANQALGRLDGVTSIVPDPDLLLHSFVRKEAVLSSQIEGTQSSLSDLLLFEQDAAPRGVHTDVRQTSNYIAAVRHGLDRMAAGFPVSLRLIREMHALLVEGTRGAERDPGEFRRSQNWIGGTRPATARFVPPPPQVVMPAMGSLERFIHGHPEPTPLLVRTGLAHAQFETIHPFLDGNGRLGRLLITLMLCGEGVLSSPLLYLSLYFKQHRDEYYDTLQRIRTHGAWEEWLGFFLDGVIEVAATTTTTIRSVASMIRSDHDAIGGLGRAAGAAFVVHDFVIRRVVVTAPILVAGTNLSAPSVYGALRNLEGLGIVREISGRRRGRVYAHGAYLAVLSEGTD